MRAACRSILAFFVLAAPALADGPQDNVASSVRRVPKLGIDVPAADRQALEEGLGQLNGLIDRLGQQKDSRVATLLPDIQIYAKAVHDALEYREFFTQGEIAKAKALLEEGRSRAQQLLEGSAPWTSQTGLVVRGYRSKIDGSAQPFGLLIPESYTPRTAGRYRLDVWFHGRGETLSEVNFLDERRHQRGLFTPDDTIVLHPYGRYCNAFKFAGEVDVLEAIDAVRTQYRVDDDRIAMRGFSMGGAACWQFAVHYADQWFAANPGAGFAETRRFLETFQKETLNPTWYERKLWHLYDCTDVAANLAQCPTVAYSGELDNQKQAADVMAEALKEQGIELMHVIGPATKHAYHPKAKLEVDRRLDSLALKGRQRVPRQVSLVTYTLKYNRMNWVAIEALGEHWKKAEVHARIEGNSRVSIKTENVTAMALDMPPGWCPLSINQPVVVTVDGIEVPSPRPHSDRSWHCALQQANGNWTLAQPSVGLQKRHDLQGPIDDAFMDSFVFVRPTGKGRNEQVSAWAKQEGDRAIEHWRRQFRGEARVKDDTAVTDADIASANLVLWGDPESNAILKRIADRLPIHWTAERIVVGDRDYPAENHALVMVYPNPLNPDRYVVLNSGFTYRNYDYLNNARQVPKLPDWAVIDVRTPPDARQPGKVAAADFFGESWELRPRHIEESAH
ncbi:MAG TPA: prolyl oligopeptidase family serine peptidase [Isosphaeraceae bacterium]|jgi:dienelactone hydrolase|nr:prolyl oligopeptidase family serine peptidase [Isosphaeraceae bacterium]